MLRRRHHLGSLPEAEADGKPVAAQAEMRLAGGRMLQVETRLEGLNFPNAYVREDALSARLGRGLRRV
jgi:hypothetical protein